MDLLAERLSGRSLIVQNRVLNLIVIFFAATVLVGGGAMLIDLTYELRQTSPALDIPMAYVYVSLPFSGMMLIFYALVALARGPGKPDRSVGDAPT